MLKNISNLGSILSKKEQKNIAGGECAPGSKCEPWDDNGGGGSYIVCKFTYGTTPNPVYHFIRHSPCDPNFCLGGVVHESSC